MNNSPVCRVANATSKNYGSYDDLELYTLMNEPWEITDRPYLLHAAYALSCLTEALEDDDEEAEKTEIWGKTIPERILKSVVKNAAQNFNDAAQNGTRIDVWGRAFSVRKANAYDRMRLENIFDFPLHDGEYTVTKEGVKKLNDCECSSFETNKDKFKANKSFLRKVVLMAEDDENDGWDKLTDMEVAVYCWAKYYHKQQNDNFLAFCEKYKGYLYVNSNEILACLNDYSTINRRPHGMYCFDYEKVMEWNRSNGQKSAIGSISEQDAEDYWYDVALKKSFKPVS